MNSAPLTASAGSARVEEVIARLDDHDRYEVLIHDPEAEMASPEHLAPLSTLRIIDAPGRAAAAQIAEDHAAKGWPVVIIFDTTHSRRGGAPKEVADLSSETGRDHPALHPPRRPFGPAHCGRCERYRAAKRVWAA